MRQGLEAAHPPVRGVHLARAVNPWPRLPWRDRGRLGRLGRRNEAQRGRRLHQPPTHDQGVGIEDVDHLVEEQAQRPGLHAEYLPAEIVPRLRQPADLLRGSADVGVRGEQARVLGVLRESGSEIIAEDLGVITPEVEALRDRFLVLPVDRAGDDRCARASVRRSYWPPAQDGLLRIMKNTTPAAVTMSATESVMTSPKPPRAALVAVRVGCAVQIGRAHV